ncbi:MAG: hypothetical protein ABFS45_20515, partial [Pseudomonadota bacterium]
NWQTTRLFQPTPNHLEMEQRGQVFIYDGMKDKTIEQAMDIQFDRVHSMMFVRTVVTDDNDKPQKDPETGADILEEDGCD